MDHIIGLLFLLLILPENHGSEVERVRIWSQYLCPRLPPPVANITAYFAEGSMTSSISLALPFCMSKEKQLNPVELYRTTPSFKSIAIKSDMSNGSADVPLNEAYMRFWDSTIYPTLTPEIGGVYRCRSGSDVTPPVVSPGFYELHVVRKPVIECKSSYEVVFGGMVPINIIASGTLPASITRHPPVGHFDVRNLNTTRGVRRWEAKLVVNMSSEELGSEFDVTFSITYNEFRCSTDKSDPTSNGINSAYRRCAAIPTSATCTTTVVSGDSLPINGGVIAGIVLGTMLMAVVATLMVIKFRERRAAKSAMVDLEMKVQTTGKPKPPAKAPMPDMHVSMQATGGYQ